MNTSQLTITQLASTINAHTGKAHHYVDKAEQHYKAAGLHLIEAKRRIASGEYEGGFVLFLRNECKGLSKSRAYELIAIGNGTTTVATQRDGKAKSMQKSRDAVRHVVDIDTLNTTTTDPLKERKSVAEAEAALIRNMPGYELYIETQEEKLANQISAACKGVTVEELLHVLNYLHSAEKTIEKVTED